MFFMKNSIFFKVFILVILFVGLLYFFYIKETENNSFKQKSIFAGDIPEIVFTVLDKFELKIDNEAVRLINFFEDKEREHYKEWILYTSEKVILSKSFLRSSSLEYFKKNKLPKKGSDKATDAWFHPQLKIEKMTYSISVVEALDGTYIIIEEMGWL